MLRSRERHARSMSSRRPAISPVHRISRRVAPYRLKDEDVVGQRLDAAEPIEAAEIRIPRCSWAALTSLSDIGATVGRGQLPRCRALWTSVRVMFFAPIVMAIRA